VYVTSNLVIQKFVFLNVSVFFTVFVIMMKKYRLLINYHYSCKGKNW